MWKFLAGALIMFLYYNQGNIRRGYYTVKRELNLVHRVVVIEQRQDIEVSEVEPPVLDTVIEVQEPSLRKMQMLGFNVKEQ